jgi:methylase of polypeptide subunit release factors
VNSPAQAAAPRLVEPDDRTLAGLRTALIRSEYTQKRVAAALGPRPPRPTTRREVYLRRLAEAGDLGTLVRLFRLGEPVPGSEVAAAVGPADVDALAAAGVLEEREDRIVGSLALTPYEGLFVVHDSVDPSLPVAGWKVLLGSASRTLAALTIRQPVRRALDLGTGCGIQALLAARHADHVVATDLSDRALVITRINASLNGFDNIECRQGSLFEPVQGERFGLVVSNPPFVVSPDSDVMFRDSDLPGDEISRVVVTQAQELLDEGGHATILCSWIAPPDAHWSTPLRAWVGGNSDALLLQFTSVGPLQYAAMWTENIDRWLAYYRDKSIEWISTGAVILRREGAGRIVTFQATGAPREGAGEQLLRIFEAHQDLAEHGGEKDGWLLAGRFRLVDHSLSQDADFRDCTYTVGLTGVSIPGTPLNARVDPDAVHVLPRLDGSAALADVIARAAREAGLDRERIQQATLPTVRRLYERGFLVRV